MNIEDRSYIDTDAGIYYFKNTLNNKYYIGQSVNIRKRVQRHIRNVNNNTNAPLYNAIRKYGIKNFEFGILQRIDKDEPFLKSILDFWERYYIVLYNSYTPRGYNQTVGGDIGVLGLRKTEEQKQLHSIKSRVRANDGRYKVYCYDTVKHVTILCPTLVALSNYLHINFERNALKNLLVAGKYVLARTLNKLHEKVNTYNNTPITRNIDGKFSEKITKEALQDIISGMRQRDWIVKYNMSKASYSKHKRKLKEENLLIIK